MSPKCNFCEPSPQQILKTGSWTRILIPDRLHISPEDGGHLVVAPIRHVRNRILLSESEATEIWRFSIISANLLKLLLNIDWYNFQENGNWTVDDPIRCHMHLHIYGRDRSSKSQPFGEALRLPLKIEIESWKFGKYTKSMEKKLHEYAKDFEA